MKKSDRKLGMNREITRRDFLNGASMAIGGSLLTSSGLMPRARRPQPMRPHHPRRHRHHRPRETTTRRG